MSEIIFGRQAVRAFLKSTDNLNSVIEVYYAQQFPKSLRSEFHHLINHPSSKSIPTKELDQICNKRHQGIVVKVKSRSSVTMDSAISWKDLLLQKPGLYLLTDRIQDPGNLGSMIRSAEALGARGLFVTGKGARRTALVDRIAAGASFHIPVIEAGSAGGFLNQAKKDGYWILSAAMDETDLIEEEFELDSEVPEVETTIHLSTQDLNALPDTCKFILVIGHEGEGIRPGILKISDYKIHIPMRGKTESLNAAVAAAILIERIIDARPPEQCASEAL